MLQILRRNGDYDYDCEGSWILNWKFVSLGVGVYSTELYTSYI